MKPLVIVLVSISIFFSFAAIRFYFRQNSSQRIGGPISKPKAFWLWYALYLYFILGIGVMVKCSNSVLHSALVFFIFAIYGRALVQPTVMYFYKSWTPKYGIGFNIIVATILSVRLGSTMTLIECDKLVFSYLLTVAIALYVDSWYAYKFHQIVGDKTKGVDAIWYASAVDERFVFINRVTYLLNILFFMLVVYVLFQIFAI